MTDESTVDLGIDGIVDARPVGAGGFATVYAATEQDFQRTVAIKVLHSVDQAGRRRFERERLVMGQLSEHPNVVTPYRFGYTSAGQPFLIMEYLRGGSLLDRIDADGPLDWPEAARHTEQIANALGHGHGHGVLHQDVKPANILLTGSGMAKLSDFGIARIVQATATTQLAFTIAHAAPETFMGGATTRDQRSDLYSLASTLYELVTGRPPFQSEADDDTAMAHMMRVMEHPVPSVDPSIAPPGMNQFFGRTLAKEPADRPSDHIEFAELLSAVPFDPGPTGPGGTTPMSTANPAWAPKPRQPSGPSPVPVAAGGTPPSPSPPLQPPVPVPVGGGAGVDPSADTRHAEPSPAPAERGSRAGTAGIIVGSVAGVGAVLGLLLASFLVLSTGANDDLPNEPAAPEIETTTTAGPDDAEGEVDTTTTQPNSFGNGDVLVTGPEQSEVDAGAIQMALSEWGSANDLNVTYVGSADWSDEIAVQVASGDTPDISFFPQLQQLDEYADSGDLVPVSSEVAAASRSSWTQPWRTFGEVDGTVYGVPVKADVKSLVWYKPDRFAASGYEIPETWDELVELTDRMIADGNTPWCIGIESGRATGWVFTDWAEDVLLGTEGADVYDRWVAHDITFSDERVITAFGRVLTLWNTDGAVFGGAEAIAAVDHSDEPAIRLAADDCFMVRQASFLSAFLPADSLDEYSVFQFPAVGGGTPLVGAGVQAAAFNDDPDTVRVMEYLAGAEYAADRQRFQAELSTGRTSGFFSAALGQEAFFEPTDTRPTLHGPLEQAILTVLQDADTVRLDASDLMPPEIGAGAFWAEGTRMVAEGRSPAESAAAIDAAWPG